MTRGISDAARTRGIRKFFAASEGETYVFRCQEMYKTDITSFFNSF
jgi:hypothetical protein